MVQSALLKSLMKAGSIPSTTLSDSHFFTSQDTIPIDLLPAMNLAFTGDFDGGMTPGLTMFAGPSKSLKTILGMFCLKAFQTKYPDGVVLFYDSEYGTIPKQWVQFGLNTDMIAYHEVEHVEALKFDLAKKLAVVKREDPVMVFIDSIGAMTTKKEMDDALAAHSAADMGKRAQQIRSLLRILMTQLVPKNIPAIGINHVYVPPEMHARTTQSGGTAVTYNANQVFFMSQRQYKEGGEKVGTEFVLRIEKSRTIKPGSTFSFVAKNNRLPKPETGLMELAIEAGIIKQSGAWYQLPGEETKVQRKGITPEFLIGLTKHNEEFRQFVRDKFQLSDTMDDVSDDTDQE